MTILAAAAFAGCGSSATTTTAPSPLARCGVTVTGPASVPAQGGSGTVNVSAARECTWTASVEGQWLAIKSGTSGQGNGTVEFTAAVNPDPVTRRGAIALNDQRVEVTQAAGECAITLADKGMSFGQSGGSGRVEVRASSELCTWKAESDADWIVLRSEANGKGTAPVMFDVLPASGPTRSGAIKVAGQVFTISQAQGCAYTINPASFAAPAAGGSGSIRVTTTPGCSWTAASSVSWLTLSPGAGEGPGAIGFTVAPSGGAERSGTATIAGQTFSVTQGQACTYAVEPLAHSVGAAGGSISVRVLSPAGCAWTASSSASWITLTGPAAGTGPADVGFTVAATDGGARSGTVIVAGQAVAVTQASSCSFAISPQNAQVAAPGGSGKVTVTTAPGCAWTATSNADWIQITSGATGSASAEVAYSVAPSIAARSGTLTIAGQTFTVSQSAACAYTIDPEQRSFDSVGGDVTVSVSAANGCIWTAVSTVPWMTVKSNGPEVGNGSVKITVAENGGAARSGTATIAGRTFTAQQTGPACTYTVKPRSFSVSDERQWRLVEVEAASGCSWTATSDVAWIRIPRDASGSGRGEVWLFIDENETGDSRTGTVTVAGQTVTITQKKN